MNTNGVRVGVTARPPARRPGQARPGQACVVMQAILAPCVAMWAIPVWPCGPFLCGHAGYSRPVCIHAGHSCPLGAMQAIPFPIPSIFRAIPLFTYVPYSPLITLFPT